MPANFVYIADVRSNCVDSANWKNVDPLCDTRVNPSLVIQNASGFEPLPAAVGRVTTASEPVSVART